jgi:hypothetical protein
MKGIALPIEAIVIIAITILVVVVITVFFVAMGGKQAISISDYDALGKGCTELALRYNCNAAQYWNVKIPNYDASATGCNNNGTFCVACKRNGYDTAENCSKLACKCP